MLNHLNTAQEVPKKGDLLVLMTKKSKCKIAVVVKDVINGNEVLLNKASNSYFIWDMYREGDSWVWRVWNIGSDITLTASLNNTNKITEY